MKLFNQFTLLAIWCVLTSSFVWGGGLIEAQAPYLESIGSTEVELMSFLDQLEGQPKVKRVGDRIEVLNESISATYILSNGKVCAITYFQYFSSESEAILAYNSSMNFLYRRGVTLQQIRNEDEYKVLRGRGQDFNANLTLLPNDGRYRMDAALTCFN